MSFAAGVAPEIDRLVLAVNQAAGQTAHVQVDRLVAELGLDTPALLKHYAEFLLSGRLTAELAVRRLPYQPPERVLERIAVWQSLDLVIGSSDAMAASNQLEPLLTAILEARASVAASLWSTSEEFDEALDVAGLHVERIPDVFELAVAHRGLPDPSDRYLCLHHRLTTLRYVRSQAHVEAWQTEGLHREEIESLTALWRGRPLEGTVPRGLVERSLVTDDPSAITPQGRALRDRVEALTDATTDAFFDLVPEDERERFPQLLRELPGTRAE